MPDEIIPAEIFSEKRREYAQREELSSRNYMELLKPEGYTGPEKERELRLKAYALVQIDILENTMLDTRRKLAGFDIYDADRLFRKQLSDLQKTKEHALNGYIDKDIRRRILWHEIGDIWGHANSEIEKLPISKVEASKEDVAKAA